jgi:hypothetical protein
MFCHSKNVKDSAEQSGVVGESTDSPCEESSLSMSRARKFGLVGVAATATGLLAPHALCVVLAIGGATGFLGWSYSNWCSHHASAEMNDLVPLRKLDRVPENFTEFPKDIQKTAEEKLLLHQPGFYEVLEKKRQESPGANILISFIQDNDTGDAVVVCCKNGPTCPCNGKSAQVYVLGKAGDPPEVPEFRGQDVVLRELAAGETSQ